MKACFHISSVSCPNCTVASDLKDIPPVSTSTDTCYCSCHTPNSSAIDCKHCKPATPTTYSEDTEGNTTDELREQNTLLKDTLKQVIQYAAPDGTQTDGDFVGFYVSPTGKIHKAIAVLQGLGLDVQPCGDVSNISRYQALTQRIALEARIDELQGIFKYIGDLNMERVGISTIDEQTNIKEQERRWFHEALSDQVARLKQQLRQSIHTGETK